MAIIAGFSFSSVHRLHFTVEELPEQIQKVALFEFSLFYCTKVKTEMERMMNSDGNFKTYRQLLSSADPPCLPYL